MKAGGEAARGGGGNGFPAGFAPCGVLCDLCLGFQREKNRCVGCLREGYKPYHCAVCSIKLCPEKKGNPERPCGECEKYPCRRIRDLNKRYTQKYGESIFDNFQLIRELGMQGFLDHARAKYTCPECGGLLCVHRKVCLSCGAPNGTFPADGPGKAD